MARLSARERIRRGVEKWFVTEPLFLSVWTLHEIVVNPRIDSVRSGGGRIEYNPAFIEALKPTELDAVLVFEAMRLVLKHPYSRRKPQAEMAYFASNITLREYIDTLLPVPRARQVFGGGKECDLQYFELYYAWLLERSGSLSSSGVVDRGVAGRDAAGRDAAGRGETDGAGEGTAGEAGGGGSSAPLRDYVDPSASGEKNTQLWDADDLFASAVDEKIITASETNAWGTLAGRHRERILASLRPKLDYRAVLRQFRRSVLSIDRRLTRMKPSRRYGFLYMGSRYEFTTKLLVAVDVSGSMGSEDLARGFSVVNRFFKYGVRSVDVIQFDTEIKGALLSLRRARHEIVIEGRGGTSFDPVIEFIDDHPGYDGLIVFTDGYAPVPRPPRSRSTRVLWLFTHEHTYRDMQAGLRSIGPAAFLREG